MLHNRSMILLGLAILTLGGCSGRVAEDDGSQTTDDSTEEHKLFTPRRLADDDEAGKQIVFTEDQAVELGVGYDADAGEFLTDKKCVLFVAAEKGGEQATMTVSSVVDQHSLNDALEVEAGAEVNTLFGSGSGKASFSKQVEVNSSFLNYAVHAYVQAVERYARGVPLDEQLRRQYFEEGWGNDRESEYQRSSVLSGTAILLAGEHTRLARRDQDAFREACGEGFVSSVYRGVEVAGVITLETYSETEQQSFATEFEVSGAFWSAEAQAAGTSSESRSRENLKVTYYESGRSDEPLPTTIDSLMSRAQNVKQLLADPRLYKVAVTPYSRLANWPTPGEDLESVEPAAEPLLYLYSAYRELFDVVRRVLDDPSKFALTIDAGSFEYQVTNEDLRNAQDTLTEYLGALRALIEECDRAGWDDPGCQDFSDVQDSLLSPYGFRARIPPPKVPDAEVGIVGLDMASVNSVETESEVRAAIAQAVLWRHRDRACRAGPEFPGCVSNQQIREFIPLIPVRPKN